ncbi:MAG: cell division protein FtsZ [Alphaproteobacteria bacterium]|nr:cell division protein FtsZ [Alphaproteobacteria bacterium]
MINVKMQQPTEVKNLSPKIAVIGVGGAGGNAVNNMIASNLDGCEFLVCNTDAQSLQNSLSDHKVQLGTTVTGGLGAGSNPDVGRAAAEESLDQVLQYLDGANMAFVTCGMGGGTGTGAAPVIAKACRDQGILTVGVVTKPFHFEGAHRMAQAEAGIREMQQYVDTLIVIPNQNLFRVANEKTTFAEGFKMADTVLQSGVRGVTDLMVRPGLVNLDFADIRTAMLQMGKAMMGTGEASGEKRAVEAAEAAINNPLLDDVSMKGAKGVIINVTGGYDMTLFEADEACNRIRDEVDPDANIIFGATFDDSMDGFMRVSIVATGIQAESTKTTTTTDKSPGKPVDRAVPNSTSSLVQDRASRVVTGRDAIKGLTAPAPLTAPTQTETVSEHREAGVAESIDMFEQAEFSDIETLEPPRATFYNASFIPPKPLEPDVRIPENGIGSHISSFHGKHVPVAPTFAQQTVEQPVRSAPTGLQLNPPKVARPQEQEQAQAKSPSLFERITGSVQQHFDSFREEASGAHKMQASEISSSPTFTSSPTFSSPNMPDASKALSGRPLTSPSQGSLNISAPSGKASVKLDDELDIPAFLRRQAN